MTSSTMEKKHNLTHSECCNRVADFYDGKSIFLTGSSGFLGSVLLECLLRCCPGIHNIYILLRSKRGKDAQERKAKILEKTIFNHLKRENPYALSKIRVVSGDITQPRFGISDEDYETITEQVSIVFLCAACIALDKPIEFILKRNCVSVENAIQLCRKIKKLDALVYTSTAFSNCNRTFIKECIYRLPFPSQTFIDALNKSKEELQSVVDECQPPWPNTYTFSKCLAENILAEKAADIPTAIVRPSGILCTTLKSPLPGYIEDSSGFITLSTAIGKGFIKAVRIKPDFELNSVPVDASANAHILCAWIVGTGRYSSPFVVNCAKSGYVESVSKFLHTLLEFRPVPLPNSFSRRTNHVVITDNLLLYKIVAFFQHYVPAYVIDKVLEFKGKKPRLTPLYELYDYMLASLFRLTRRTIRFNCDSYEMMSRLLHPEDKEIFDTNVKDFSSEDLLVVLPIGAPFLDPKIDKRTKEDREKVVNQRCWMIRTIKTTAVLLFIGIFYLASCLLYQLLKTFFLVYIILN